MFFINEKNLELVKCSSKKVEVGFIALDKELDNEVSRLFNGRKYGTVKVSKEVIECLKLLNDEIINIHNEELKKIETTISEMKINEIVSNQITKMKEQTNRVEKSGDNFILYDLNKNNNLRSFFVIGIEGDNFIVKTANSTASKRKAKTFRKPISNFKNANIVIMELQRKEIEEMEKVLKAKKQAFENLENVA